MNDPFQATAELGYKGASSLGENILGVAGLYAKKRQEEIQKQQSMNMLKQMGILIEEQPNLKDYEKLAKQNKATIVASPSLSEEEKLNQAKNLTQAFGLPQPKTDRWKIDIDKASKLGLSYDLNTGATTIKPPKEGKTLLQQIAEAQTATERGLEYKGGKVQTRGSGGFGAAQIAFAEKNAPFIAEQMKRGEVGGYERSTAQTRTAVAGILGQEGINIDDLLLGYKSEQSSMANAKIQDQKVNNAISAQTLLNASYDPKTGDYKVPPSMHVELALSVARMLSQTGVVPYDMVQELRQKTLMEGLAGAAIWLGFDPKEVGGSTQSVINLFAKTIEREGLASEKMRDTYATGKRSSFKEFKQTGKSVTDVAGLTSNKPPSNVAYYSKSQNKYYDAQGNEVK